MQQTRVRTTQRDAKGALVRHWEQELMTGEERRQSRVLRFAHVFEAEVKTPLAALVSLAVMVALAFLVNALNIPNPNIFLMTGLVVCASLLGYRGGIVAGVVMMAYTLWFFSTGNDFVTFNEQNMQKVIVSFVGVVVVTFFVSSLNYIVGRAFGELERLADRLEEDNVLLEHASSHDQLTETRNRFALRRDFAGYLDAPACVMMLDVDNFKETNDVYGHNTGDFILNRIGLCLIDEFTEKHVYRYGGDEFLVIYPADDAEGFAAKVDAAVRAITSVEVGDSAPSIKVSGGYVSGTPVLQSDLRLMIRQADVNLYEAKEAGKNQVVGCPFSRIVAENAQITGHGAKERVTDSLHHS